MKSWVLCIWSGHSESLQYFGFTPEQVDNTCGVFRCSPDQSLSRWSQALQVEGATSLQGCVPPTSQNNPHNTWLVRAHKTKWSWQRYNCVSSSTRKNAGGGWVSHTGRYIKLQGQSSDLKDWRSQTLPPSIGGMHLKCDQQYQPRLYEERQKLLW